MAAAELAQNGVTNPTAMAGLTAAPDAAALTNTVATTTTTVGPEQQPGNPIPGTATEAATDKRWSGWPGDCVFRLIVPVLKVGSIIGRKGDLIKKMCEETRARIRVLDGAVGTPDRIVLISGKEELEALRSPAMDAVIRVFRRVNGLPENEAGDITAGAAGVAFCSTRLLVPSTQAISLIGKQGTMIKSIQENSGASVRVLAGDDVPSFVAPDERIIELQGEGFKVLKALETVVGHLRKFLVDHSVLPLFEKPYSSNISQELQVEAWPDKPTLVTSRTGIETDYPFSGKKDHLYIDRETQLESQITSSGLQSYGQDSRLTSVHSLGLNRTNAPIITQVAQTMQIPLSYAEDIIGTGGANIAYIRRTSGAVLTVQESGSLPDEITVEIKGTSSQVQIAQELIQEFISNHREPVTSSYGKIDTGFLSSYTSQLGSSYASSSLSSQPYSSRYGSSGLGGYTTFRL
ncbi:hypothetical protein Nepgr_019785 [Nepenthes gracilis]|uniref:K Homology domain-containing protein n=1 Tax=Nepenthes gracilis TaxID=150966 RepID=A0AAD3SWG0_NEPGR|nr:hypothetical protein Nepgr_019785 [Nepenthes gracilis]